MQAWQRFFWGRDIPSGFATSGSPARGGQLFVLAGPQVSVGRRQIKSSHGCFDNSTAIVSETLRAMLGEELRRKVTDLDY